MVAGRREDLVGDMISAGVKVRVKKAGGDSVGCATQDEGVDQTVALASGDVVTGVPS